MLDGAVAAYYAFLGYLNRTVPRDSMVRRVIAAILMFSVLGYGTAWAFEWHSVDIADHAHATEYAYPAPQADHEGCDHCCHAGAHLVGLAQRSQPFSPNATAPRLANGAAVFVTRFTDPPLKPPQS